MGRNLYILAATLLLLALVSCGVSYTNVAQQPGSPGDVSLWRTMGLAMFVISLVVTLGGIFASLFEQAGAARGRGAAKEALTIDGWLQVEGTIVAVLTFICHRRRESASALAACFSFAVSSFCYCSKQSVRVPQSMTRFVPVLRSRNV